MVRFWREHGYEILLGGDFNNTLDTSQPLAEWAADLGLLAVHTVLEERGHTSGMPSTFYTSKRNEPTRRIDHLFATRALFSVWGTSVALNTLQPADAPYGHMALLLVNSNWREWNPDGNPLLGCSRAAQRSARAMTQQARPPPIITKDKGEEYRNLLKDCTLSSRVTSSLDSLQRASSWASELWRARGTGLEKSTSLLVGWEGELIPLSRWPAHYLSLSAAQAEDVLSWPSNPPPSGSWQAYWGKPGE